MEASLENLYVELRALRVKTNSQDYKDKNKHCKEKKKMNKKMIQRRSYLESVVQINFQLVVGRL